MKSTDVDVSECVQRLIKLYMTWHSMAIKLNQYGNTNIELISRHDNQLRYYAGEN